MRLPIPPHRGLHSACHRVASLTPHGRPLFLRPSALCPPPGWENVDDSSCQLVPHLHIWHGKCPFRSFCFRRKAGSLGALCPPALCSPLWVTLEPCSSSLAHGLRPSLKEEGPQHVCVERKMGWAACLLQISEALLRSLFGSWALLPWAFSSLTCYVSSL